MIQQLQENWKYTWSRSETRKIEEEIHIFLRLGHSARILFLVSRSIWNLDLKLLLDGNLPRSKLVNFEFFCLHCKMSRDVIRPVKEKPKNFGSPWTEHVGMPPETLSISGHGRQRFAGQGWHMTRQTINGWKVKVCAKFVTAQRWKWLVFFTLLFI